MKMKGLSLAQEKAACILAVGKYKKDKDIADETGVSLRTFRDWKANTRFKLRVLQLFEDNMALERSNRAKVIGVYLDRVHIEIGKKIKEGSIGALGIKDLMRLMSQLNNELRQDSIIPNSVLVRGKEDEWENGNDEDDDLDILKEAKGLYSNEISTRKVVKLHGVK